MPVLNLQLECEMECLDSVSMNKEINLHLKIECTSCDSEHAKIGSSPYKT